MKQETSTERYERIDATIRYTILTGLILLFVVAPVVSAFIIF